MAQNQLAALKGLLTPGMAASDSNFTPTGDPYADKRKARIMSGEDVFEPTELEQRRMQTENTIDTTDGDPNNGGVISILSRDMMRDSGYGQLKRKLKLDEISNTQATERALAPVEARGRYDMALDKQKGANALSIAQERSRGAIEAARLKAESADRASAAKGAGAKGNASMYGAERAGRAREMIAAILPQVHGMTTGVAGNLQYMPFPTSAGKLAGDLGALKSNIIQGELTEMREASKTGGALGNVSDRENDMLARAFGNLDQVKQNPKMLREVLQQIDASLQRWQKAKQDAANGLDPVLAGEGLEDDPYGLFED